MITSPTRNSDLEDYLMWLDILEITIRAYTRAEDKTFFEQHIKSQKEYIDKLKAKIDGHDYTAEDKRYWDFEKLMKKLSPTPS